MIKKILTYRFITILNSLAILFVLGGLCWAFFSLGATGSGPFILHFNDLDGITKVGGLGTILFVGAFGIAMTLMNFMIALEFGSRDPFLGKLLSILSLVFAILLFIGCAAIIGVNV